MENFSKEKKSISYVLDTRNVSEKGVSFTLEASKEECEMLKQHYQLPNVHSFKADLTAVYKDDCVDVMGKMQTHVTQECVVTLEEFDKKITSDFHVIFSNSKAIVDAQEKRLDTHPEEEPIELIESTNIYFKDIMMEQFGLMLDPFPRKTDEPFVYYESKIEDEVENPFSVLKHLTK